MPSVGEVGACLPPSALLSFLSAPSRPFEAFLSIGFLVRTMSCAQSISGQRTLGFPDLCLCVHCLKKKKKTILLCEKIPFDLSELDLCILQRQSFPHVLSIFVS